MRHARERRGHPAVADAVTAAAAAVVAVDTVVVAKVAASEEATRNSHWSRQLL